MGATHILDLVVADPRSEFLQPVSLKAAFDGLAAQGLDLTEGREGGREGGRGSESCV